MRNPKPILAGLLGLTAIAACGMPPTARDGAPVRVAGPHDPARRYEVLNAIPVCTPTPTGTGTAAPSCDAFAGRGGSILFTVVDDGPGPDLGQVQFSHGDFEYLASNPFVEQDVDAFNQPIVRIGALFTPVYTGPPTAPDPEPTADAISVTITVNLNGFTYERDAEENEFDESGSMLVLLTQEDTCTLIPVQNLFPQPE